jgi:ribosomal protein L24
MRLRRDDKVVILNGNWRGQIPAQIVSIDRSSGTAIVEGIGRAIKHVKRGSSKSPQGGRVTIPVALRLANLAIFCGRCNRAVRMKVQFVNGTKQRVCGRCLNVV